MEYFFTSALNIIGILYMVLVSIKKLRAKYPELHPATVFATFFREEWDSLATSMIGLVLFELVLYIIHYNSVILPLWVESWGIYAFSLLWGYASQRLAYSILNTSEKVLQKKIDTIEENKKDN